MSIKDISKIKNTKPFFKYAFLTAIVVEIIIFLYIAFTRKDGQLHTVYLLFVGFVGVDLLIAGLREIIDDIRSGNELFICSYFRLRFKHWETVRTIGIARLKQRYTGTALGWAWAVLRPAMTIFCFWFALTLGLRHGGNVGDYPYFLWLVAGFTPWFYMSDMISFGAGCIRNNSYLLKVAKFPIITIPTITGISILPVHLILLSTIAVIFLLSGFPFTIYMVQLPLYMFMMVLFFDFWGLFAGTLSTISRDFMNLVNSVITALFWFSGIIYNVADLKSIWLRMLLRLNPVTLIVMGYRHCFIDKIWFFEEPVELVNYVLMLSLMIILAAKAYKKFGKILPDMI